MARSSSSHKQKSVREYVRIRPAAKVELDPRRQEAETGLRQGSPIFPGQHLIEPFLQRMQVQNVGGGIGELGVSELRGTPIGTLLLLGKIDPQKFAHQILEAVLVRVGAGELRGDLSAKDWARHDAVGFVENREIETGKMKKLQFLRIRQQPHEVRARDFPRRNLHYVGGAVPRRKLDDAQAIPVRIEPEGLGVDRNHGAVSREVRKVAAVKTDCHRSSIGFMEWRDPGIGWLKN